MKYFLYISWLLLEISLIPFYLIRRKKIKSKTVAIVRLDAFGDFVIWIKDLNSILNYYEQSGYNICLIVPHKMQDLLCEFFPLKSFNVVYIDSEKLMSSLFYRIKLTFILRKIKPEIAVAPVFSRVPLNGTDLFLLSLAASKTLIQRGYVSKSLLAGKYKTFISRLFDTILIFSNERSASGLWSHETIVNQAFTKKIIGVNKFPDYSETLRLRYQNVMQLDVPREYIVVMPGGSWHEKCWSKEKYQELVDKLNKRNYSVVLVGNGADEALCDYISGFGNSNQILNFCGKTDFKKLLYLIANSILLVGNDSLGIHVAHLMGVKSLCISWGGSFGRFVPYPANNLHKTVYDHMDCFGCTGTCPKSLINDKLPCVSTISVGDVIRGVNGLGL